MAVLFSLPLSAFSQQDKLGTLQRRKQKMEREIKLLTAARDEARSQKEATFADLELINRQVYLREQLLRTIRTEIRLLGEQITRTTNVIGALEEDIGQIQASFGRLMVVTYKALNNKSSAFYIFSSKSVSQGYQRARYFRAISRMQKQQMDLIRRTREFLAKKKIELEEQKAQKKAVAKQERAEKENLVALKEEQKVLFAKLKEDEARFDQELRTTKKALVALNKEIGKEIARLAELKRKNSKNITKAERDIILKLTNNFGSNKGKFPWPMPMPNGTITRKFGKQTLPGSAIVVELQGIDITTLPGQEVRAVFSGKVETIMPVMGQGKMVIVSHGKYYTVYANLQSVSVTAGQELSMLDSIGTARTDPGSGETKIHFQVYKDRVPLNPESWLVKKS